MFNDTTMGAVHSALSGLSARQRTIADNIANINTPGFLAGRVEFENALKSAVESGESRVSPTVARSLEPTREDGNNVNLDTETLLNVDTNLRYQLATQAISGQFSSVRAAMRTS